MITATQQTFELNGKTFSSLYNEVTNKNEACPLTDFDDQVHLPVLLGWVYEKIDRLLLDEFHDFTKIEVKLALLRSL